MAQKQTHSTTERNRSHDLTARKGHATHRELRGADRRAERREWREAAIIVLHPALFEQTYGVAA